MKDTPEKDFNKGAKYPVNFYAQSTVILDGKRGISIGWGFNVTMDKQKNYHPTILNSTTSFHTRAVNSLLNKINK